MPANKENSLQPNATSQNGKPFFHPAFGSRPAEIIGRDDIISSIINGLKEPIGSQKRCTFLLGQRGMGKTALLLELADRTKKENFVIVRVAAWDGMPDEIIEGIQFEGEKHIKKPTKKVQGFEAGALGFSFGLTFTTEANAQYGFRTKLSMLCDKLAESGLGVLLLIDEAQTSDAMRQVATTYQNLVGDEKNIAIVMAGLPHAVSSVLNDKVLTFLNRANKIHLGPVSLSAVRLYYSKVFAQVNLTISEDVLADAIEATGGFPYMIQLVGYYLVEAQQGGQLSAATLATALACAQNDMDSNVYRAAMASCSEKDTEFLIAAAKAQQPGGCIKIAEILNILGAENSQIQPYRARMLDEGIIEAPRKGELTFAIPGMADYLRRKYRDD